MMLQTNAGHKLTEMHLERAAVVYLRQSTEKQVRHNGENRRLQYALKDRARELGFTSVRVIDSDLGSSAAVGAATRAGFDQLVASVAVGEVGMILSREVSRLSRTDKDWARLMEVCQLYFADATQEALLAAMQTVSAIVVVAAVLAVVTELVLLQVGRRFRRLRTVLWLILVIVISGSILLGSTGIIVLQQPL